MNLIIDVGNTFIKLAVFELDSLICKHNVKQEDFSIQINTLRVKYPSIQKCIISSVGRLEKKSLDTIKRLYDVLILNADTKLPITNLYSTPRTLGVDRIALVCAAVKKFPNKNILIIDAGTCITYDFLKSNKQYLGGAISPGMRIRYKSLNTLTANLPLLETQAPKNITGTSTEASIHSGVVYGILNEIDGAVDHYKTKYSDLTVILTGGDAKFLSNQLKSSIFANPNFLLEGLNFILQFNSNE